MLLIYSTQVLSIDKNELTQQQKYFLLAYDAINNNHTELAKIYKSRLQDYVLYPFLQYYDIIYNFKTTPSSKIDLFIKNNPTFVLTPRLITNYLRFLAKEKQHDQFLKYFKPEVHTSSNLRCLAYFAILQTGNKQQIKSTIKKATNLWQEQLTISTHCKPLAQYLEANKKITGQMIWARIIKNMNKGRTKSATTLSAKLSSKDKQILNYWLKVYKQPQLALNKKIPANIPPSIAKYIFKQAINRYGRSNPQKSIQILQKQYAQYNLDSSEVNALIRRIALRLAFKYHPDAQQYLAKINNASNYSNVMNWKLQVAIRESNWHDYLNIYKQLPEKDQQTSRWLYWKARALEATNQINLANKIYTKLAKKRNYYGFLSADKLNKDYNFNLIPSSYFSSAELIEKYPTLIAIQELVGVGWETNLTRKWYQLIKKADKEDLDKIANHMLGLGQYTLAIKTVARAKSWHDLNLRFPTPYKQYIQKYSKIHNIDPIWVFAVIRRESAFSVDAVSPAGAIGLMQIMRPTAKFMGQKIGLKRSQYRQLKNPKINIQLGSAYLNYLQKKYQGNLILATAAYNAGPSRVKRWMPKNKNMAADQWIDTIPFAETRAYVRAVIEYKTIFRFMLGYDKQRLSSFMPYIEK